jgi:hypothetical protein
MEHVFTCNHPSAVTARDKAMADLKQTLTHLNTPQPTG